MDPLPSSDFCFVRVLGLVAGVLLVGTLFGLPAHAQIYVDDDAAGGSGTSWGDAYADLQTAIDNATAGDEIWVAEGIYKPTSGTDETKSFYVPATKDGLKIYGGFQNGDTFSQRDPTEHRTILSGDLNGDDVDSDGDGVIEEALADEDLFPSAIRNSDYLNPPNTQKVLVFDGGRSIKTNYDPTQNITTATVVSGVTITAALAKQDDGGDPVSFGFENNSGGGIYCDGSGNVSGVSNKCSPTIKNVTFAGNAGLEAGAIGNDGTNGGISSPRIINCTFIGNAAQSGGAIYNRGRDEGKTNPKIIGAVFVDNKATDGGAIFNDGANSGGESSPQIINATFTGNEAVDGDGGAIYNNVNSFGTSEPQITNTILWGNTVTGSGSGNQMYNTGGGTAPTISYSLLEGGVAGVSDNDGSTTTDGGGNKEKNPQFEYPALPDGPDDAFATDDDGVHVLNGSPPIDAGTDTPYQAGNVAENVNKDITGATRQDGTVDIGAYEGGRPDVERTIYVDASASGDSTGLDWATAFSDLNTALLGANGNDEIWIAEGVYTPSSTGRFTITGYKDGLDVYGGFNGTETSRSDRDPTDYRTVLSGDVGGDDNNKTADGITPRASDIAGGENVPVLLLDGNTGGEITNATLIDGVTVTAGKDDSGTGGGLYCDGSNSRCSPTIRNASFVGNLAGDGGGIYNDGSFSGVSSPRLTNVAFTGNAASNGGGAIYNSANTAFGPSSVSSPTITNATFIGNEADNGGAIYNFGKNTSFGGVNMGNIRLTIINSSFTDNSAQTNGGAVYNHVGNNTSTITNTILWGNRASNAGNQVYNDGGSVTPTISHSILEGGVGAISENNGSSTSGSDNLDTAPQFTGGPAAAGTDGAFGTRDDSLNLVPGSPALDAGDNAALDTTGNSVRDITTDVAGADRVQDLDENGTATVNIGAYETIDGYTRRVVGTDGTGNDTGWRMLALPAQGRTRADLEDDLDFSVPSGSILYRYEGGSWSAKTASSATLPRGTGFMLYFFDDSQDPLTGQGTLFGVGTGTEDPSTDQTVGSLAQNQRFHLLGNPYDTAFDLNALNLAGQGFQETVRVYDPATQNYEPVLPTGSYELSAWQGVIVERSSVGAGGTSLTFSASGKMSGNGNLIGSKADDGPTPRQTQVDLRLVVTGENEADTVATDRMTAFLSEKATAGWDLYEATQLASPGGPSATVSSPLTREDGGLVRRLLASEPYPNADTVAAPVSVAAQGTGGTATLGWPAGRRGEAPDGGAVVLVDTETGTQVDLRTEQLTFDLAPDDGAVDRPSDSRFQLKAGPPPESGSGSESNSEAVEVASFAGTSTGDGIQLQWQTAAGTDEVEFRVERRATGTFGMTEGRPAKADGPAGEWTTVGTVADDGSTYRFADDDLPYAADSLTYRLRTRGPTGKATLPPPITVERGPVAQVELLGTAPNPARSHALVRYAIPEGIDAETVTMRLYDVLGRVVRTVGVAGEPGRHVHRLDAGRLASGTYVLRLRADGATRTQKLTVVR